MRIFYQANERGCKTVIYICQVAFYSLGRSKRRRRVAAAPLHRRTTLDMKVAGPESLNDVRKYIPPLTSDPLRRTFPLLEGRPVGLRRRQAGPLEPDPGHAGEGTRFGLATTLAPPAFPPKPVMDPSQAEDCQ